MKKKKVLLCYFVPREISYTPTDIGYILAILQEKISPEYNFEIIQLNNEITRDTNEIDIVTEKKFIQESVEIILYHQAEAVFFFIENVLLTEVFALGGAMKIMRELRNCEQKLFIGLQSYKIQKEQISKVLEENYSDCVITGDPENVFLYLDKILEKSFIPGVEYQKVIYPKDGLIKLLESFEKKSCSITGKLDTIPSPYLNHIFDNYIQSSQIKRGGSFTAFLTSSRGCKFGCYYCFRSTKFEQISFFSVQRFYDELEYLFNTFKVFHFFILDDAFLYSKERLLEFDIEFKQRLVVNPSLKKIDIFVMIRPETVDEETIEILARLNVTSIQFGLQTVNPEIQHYMRREVDVLHFKLIKEWLLKYKIKLFLDIVIGLPGDSIVWLKETVRYSLLLDPHAIQIKQLFFSPDTFFHFNKKQYGIDIEDIGGDFDAPYVIKANNIDDVYFEVANDFILKQIAANPTIFWKYQTRKNNFLSSGWLVSDVIYKKNAIQNLHSKYYDIVGYLRSNNSEEIDHLSDVTLVLDLENVSIYFWSSNNTLCAIHQISGEILWKFHVRNFKKKKSIFSTPFLCEGKIYFGACDKNIYCLNAKTGKLIWMSLEADWVGSPLTIVPHLGLIFTILEFGIFKKEKKFISIDLFTGKKKDNSFVMKRKCISYFYIAEKQIVVIEDENKNLSCFESESGEVHWVNSIDKTLSTFLVFDSKSSMIIFVSDSGDIKQLSVENGSVQPLLSSYQKIRPFFVIGEGSIIFSSLDNYIYSINLETKKLQWKFCVASKVLSHLFIVDCNVFIVLNQDTLVEIDFLTGIFKSEIQFKGEIIHSLVYNSLLKRFFITTQKGNLISMFRKTSSHSLS